MSDMRKFVIRIGTINTLIIITLVAVLFSVLLTISFAILADQPIYGFMIFLAIVIPCIDAPIVGYLFVRLIFDMDSVEQRLNELVSIDQLTGGLSRYCFMETAALKLTEARRYKIPLSIMMMDLDFFKQINDNYGHQVGDEVLKTIGFICNDNKRKNDLFARYGGEEFVFLLPHCDRENAISFINKIQSSIRVANVYAGKKKITFTSSIGVAFYNPESTPEKLEKLIEYADEALYLAKRNGRNRYEIYSEGT